MQPIGGIGHGLGKKDAEPRTASPKGDVGHKGEAEQQSFIVLDDAGIKWTGY